MSCLGSIGKIDWNLRQARQTVKHCQQALEELPKKMQKYDRHLKDKGSGKVLGDVAMKIRWQVFEKEAIAEFRAAITSHSHALNMLLASANVFVPLSWKVLLSDK